MSRFHLPGHLSFKFLMTVVCAGSLCLPAAPAAAIEPNTETYRLLLVNTKNKKKKAPKKIFFVLFNVDRNSDGSVDEDDAPFFLGHREGTVGQILRALPNPDGKTFAGKPGTASLECEYRNPGGVRSDAVFIAIGGDTKKVTATWDGNLAVGEVAGAYPEDEDFRIDPFRGWMRCTLTNKKTKIAPGSGLEISLNYGLGPLEPRLIQTGDVSAAPAVAAASGRAISADGPGRIQAKGVKPLFPFIHSRTLSYIPGANSEKLSGKTSMQLFNQDYSGNSKLDSKDGRPITQLRFLGVEASVRGFKTFSKPSPLKMVCDLVRRSQNADGEIETETESIGTFEPQWEELSGSGGGSNYHLRQAWQVNLTGSANDYIDCTVHHKASKGFSNADFSVRAIN